MANVLAGLANVLAVGLAVCVRVVASRGGAAAMANPVPPAPGVPGESAPDKVSAAGLGAHDDAPIWRRLRPVRNANVIELAGCRLQLLATRALARRPLAECVRAAIEGGVDLVQLREKEATTSERVALARELLAVTAPRGVALLVNDDLDAAVELGAAVSGVHLGQQDAAVAEARRRLGPEAWIGLSTHSTAEIERGETTAATHLGLGACFATRTKADPSILTRAELARALARATRPLFAIGGITAENVGELVSLGVKRVAVSSAILASPDPAAAAAAIRSKLSLSA